MAVTQTVVLSKADSAFLDVDEARLAAASAANNSTYTTYMAEKRDAGLVTVTETFDEEAQTLTYTRVWDDDAYATFLTDTADAREANRTALEADGWTITGNPSI